MYCEVHAPNSPSGGYCMSFIALCFLFKFPGSQVINFARGKQDQKMHEIYWNRPKADEFALEYMQIC